MSDKSSIDIYDCKNCSRYHSGAEECNSCITNTAPGSVPSMWVEKKDNVNHPQHYQTENGLETIDVIEAFTVGLEGCEAYFTGNILKYMCRWKKKNGIEDLKKAQWYLQRLIRYAEVKEAKTTNN